MRNKNKEYGAIAVMIIVIFFVIMISYLATPTDPQPHANKKMVVQTAGTIESVYQTIKPGLFSDVITQTITVNGNKYTLSGYTTIFKKDQSVVFSYLEGTDNISEIQIQESKSTD